MPALALVALVLAPQSVDHDLIYMKQAGAAFTMDAFRPAKPNGAAVIYIVSGGWYSDHNGINADLAKAFNAQGITMFEVVHGAQPRYKLNDIEPMISRSIRYVRANAAKYAIGPNRIGIMGGSAGGHLSLMAGVLGDDGKPDAKDPIDRVSSKPNAIVALFPPTDMVNFGAEGRMPFKEPKYLIFQPAFPVPPNATPEQMAEVAKAHSPIYGVKAGFPPTYLIHGDKDDLVPLQQSQKLDALFASLGIDHKLTVVPGGGHGGDAFIPYFSNAIDWFNEKLKG